MQVPDNTRPDPRGPRPTVNARASLILLAAVSATLALASGDPVADAVVRPLYFATLFAFFQRIARRHGVSLGLPLHLVCAGFLVLTLGSAAAAVVGLSGVDTTTPLWAGLLVNLERGAVFLVGLGLVTFGTVLWIPRLIESQELLSAGYSRARGQLALSEQARATLEAHFEDAARLQALGELAAGIAHDLRNPLTVVRGTAAALRRRPREGTELEEHLDVIERNLNRAERTIRGLLDLGRPVTTSVGPMVLREAVDQAHELVSSEARRLGVAVDWDGGEPQLTGLQVRADPSLLQRALVNLVLNAIQVSPRGETVRIRVRWVCITAGDFAVVAIADRGPGLTPSDRKQLFKPFFSNRPGGTGLGLLSVRRIADDLGGRVGLYPRTAGGCRAILALPTVAAHQPALPSAGGIS